VLEVTSPVGRLARRIHLPRKDGIKKQLFGRGKQDSGDDAVIHIVALQQTSFGKMADDQRTDDSAKTKKCKGCESQKLRLILRFLDPRTGNHVRLYKCECGERIWEE
jgi:hypothetical protein